MNVNCFVYAEEVFEAVPSISEAMALLTPAEREAYRYMNEMAALMDESEIIDCDSEPEVIDLTQDDDSDKKKRESKPKRANRKGKKYHC